MRGELDRLLSHDLIRVIHTHNIPTNYEATRTYGYLHSPSPGIARADINTSDTVKCRDFLTQLGCACAMRYHVIKGNSLRIEHASDRVGRLKATSSRGDEFFLLIVKMSSMGKWSPAIL